MKRLTVAAAFLLACLVQQQAHGFQPVWEEAAAYLTDCQDEMQLIDNEVYVLQIYTEEEVALWEAARPAIASKIVSGWAWLVLANGFPEAHPTHQLDVMNAYNLADLAWIGLHTW